MTVVMDPTNPYTSDGFGRCRGCRSRSRSGRPNCGGRRPRIRLTVCLGLRTTSDVAAGDHGSIADPFRRDAVQARERERETEIVTGSVRGPQVGWALHRPGKEEKGKGEGEAHEEDGAEHGETAWEEQVGAAVVAGGAAAGPLPRRPPRPPPPARRARHRSRRLQRPQPPPRPLLRLRRPLFRLRFVRTLPRERPVRRRRAALHRGVQETRQDVRGGWSAHPHR